MPNFMAIIHQIIFWLRLCQDLTGKVTALPQTLYMDLRGPNSKEGKEKEGRGEVPCTFFCKSMPMASIIMTQH